MEKSSVRQGRADCGACHTKLSLSIPLGEEKGGDLHCPNCGAAIARPPALAAEGDAKNERS
jgi:predicted RNA-binding Zn-ribbon protein involved in translation (DUF1610 family)